MQQAAQSERASERVSECRVTDPTGSGSTPRTWDKGRHKGPRRSSGQTSGAARTAVRGRSAPLGAKRGAANTVLGREATKQSLLKAMHRKSGSKRRLWPQSRAKRRLPFGWRHSTRRTAPAPPPFRRRGAARPLPEATQSVVLTNSNIQAGSVRWRGMVGEGDFAWGGAAAS